MKTKYLLIDFNCSQQYTHHWSSFLSYSEFLSSRVDFLESWLPKYSKSQIIEEITKFSPVKNFLHSFQYSTPQFSSNPIEYLFVKLISRLFKYQKTSIISKYLELQLIKLYLRKPISKIKKILSKNNLVIIFPTFDILAFNLLSYFYSKNSQITFCLRRMGAENRSILSKGNELNKLIKMINYSNNCEIRLGIPTQSVLNELNASYLEKSKNLFWSPLPSTNRLIERRQVRKNQESLYIGFPGTARKSKGYSLLPEIAKGVLRVTDKAIFVIQKPLHPWPEFTNNRESLVKTGIKIIELAEVLTVDEYQKNLNLLDLIVLPYEHEFYRNADSGILFEAADRHIPIACFDNLGFSQEAYENNIAKYIPANFDFIEILNWVINREFEEDFNRYNNKRNNAILEFLKLGVEKNL